MNEKNNTGLDILQIEHEELLKIRTRVETLVELLCARKYLTEDEILRILGYSKEAEEIENQKKS